MTKTSKRECKELIDASHIDLYRHNAFRVTGLHVDASNREVARHSDKLKMLEELGHGASANSSAYVLSPLPSVEDIKQALQRLKNPQQRLIDEFFWFWPEKFGESSNDPALQAIQNGDAQEAYGIWSQWEEDESMNFIGSHNIAIMFHMTALDWTVFHIADDVDEEREEKIKGYWRESFSRWEEMVTDERIWDSIKDRIRSLDDPQLKTGFARRMRDTLPEALDKVNAEVALKFAEQGRTSWAETHVQFMNETHQGLDDVEKTAELVLAPTRSRIKQFVSEAEDAIKAKAAQCSQDLFVFLGKVRPLLHLFELFYSSDSDVKSDIHDEVAEVCLKGAIAYQRASGENEIFLKLLRASQKTAVSISLRRRIEENIDIAEGNIRIKKLDPLFQELEKIQESAEGSAWEKLEHIKTKVMPILMDILEDESIEEEMLERAYNSTAIVLRGISVDAYNNDNNFKTAKEAIQLAGELAKDPELVKKIKEDAKVVDEAFADLTCHFCGLEPADNNFRVPYPMHKIVKSENPLEDMMDLAQGKVRYRTLDLRIPRCSNCSQIQSNPNRGWGLWATLTVIGIIIGPVLSGEDYAFPIFIAFSGLGLAFVIIKQVTDPAKKLRSAASYGKVKELYSEGWKTGSKPN